jgi:FtsH-binding integral membrane protein
MPGLGRDIREETFMSDFDRNIAARGGYAGRAVAIDAGLRAYMLRVYNYMATAVALTGVASWFTFLAAVNTDATGRIISLTPFGQAIFSGPMVIFLVLATLGLVFFISFRIHKLEYITAFVLFMVYAALLGVMLSSVFLAYTLPSITRVFFISAASFGALSLYGYTTQRDLSGLGSFLMMGLVGIILASIVNLIWPSGALSFAISVIGVLVFAGLTAYDTQRIKEMYDVNDDGTASGRKAVMGALSLYLDFINLFLMLLRLFGERR